jgi:hypothetical protein
MIHSCISRYRRTVWLCSCRHWSSASAASMSGYSTTGWQSKSDAIQFKPCRGRSNINDIATVNVSGVAIQPAATVKSLGVILDRCLSFDQHISNVCKACYFHIRALRHVRDCLLDDVARTVACSIVSSRLDYCNSLYAGMSSANFTRLQRVQNTLARVILKQRKSDHITPSLIQLHWLPVRRVTFKLASITYKILRTHLTKDYFASVVPEPS